MVDIKFIVTTEKFKKDVKKIKDRGLKERLQKQIHKVIENPEFGKPLRYDFKERTVYLTLPCLKTGDSSFYHVHWLVGHCPSRPPPHSIPF